MTSFIFSPEQVAAIIAEYQAGASLHQLAQRYGCDFITIRDYLVRAGIARRPRGDNNNPQGRRAR